MFGIRHRNARAGLLASASLLAVALGAQAQVTDYANGSDNTNPIVLTNNSTQLQVLTGSATQSGAISDGGSGFGFEKIGAGTLTLSGNNTYLGVTTISAGALVAGNGNALGGGGNVTISNGATLGIAGGVTVGNSVFVDGNAKLDVASGTAVVANIFETGAGGNLTKTGTGTLTVFNTFDISGTTTVGAGTLHLGADGLLNGTSDFVVSSGGTLDLDGHFGNSLLSLSGGGTVTNSNNGTGVFLTIGDGVTTSDTVFSGVIEDSTGGILLGLDSPGSLTLTGANTYTGGTLICSCSTLKIGDGGTTGSILGNVSDLGSLIFNRSDPYTFPGTINGTGRVSQNGSGVLTLTGGNAYNGGTFINAGTVNAGSDTALGSGAVTMVAGTTLAFTGNRSLGNDIGLTGDPTFFVDTNQTVTLSGTISDTDPSDPGVVEKTGAGTLILTGINSYSGGTTLSAGTLSITNENALGTGTVTLAGGTALQLDGTFNTADTGTTLTNGIQFTGNASIDVTTTNIAEISGDISEDSSPRALTKTGDGTLILSGTSNYTGATIVSAGTLELATGLASAPYSDYSVASGATIALDGFDFFDFNTLSGTGGTVQFNNGASLYLGYIGPGGASTFSGTLTGDGDLTVAGTAMLTLNGNVAHSLTNVTLCDCTISGPAPNPGGLTLHAGVMNVSGTTDVENGTLTVENGAQWNTDQLYVVSTMVVDAAQVTVTRFTGIGDPFASPSSLTIRNGAVVQSQGGGAGVDGTISGIPATVLITGSGSQWNVSGGELEIGLLANGAVTVTDGGALVATDGLHIYSGVGFGSGVLNIGTGGLGGTVSAPLYFTNDGQIIADFTDSVTLADNIDGAGSLTKKGIGTLTLSGFNSYGGATSVQGGTLFITASGALPAATDVTVSPGATLKLDDGVGVAINTLSDGAGSGSPASVMIGTSDVNTSLTIGGGSGTSTFSGQITGAGSLLFKGGGTMVLAGAGGSIGGEFDIGNPSAPGLTGGLTITGSLNSAGTTVVLDGTLTVSNGGTLTSGATAIVSPFFGAAAPSVIVTGSGSTWNVAGGLSIGDAFGPGPGTVTVADGGTLSITTNNLLNIGPHGVLNIGSGGGAGTLDVPGIQNNGQIVADFDTTTDVNLDAGIDGVGTLTKDGAGKLTLSGVNGYAGDTDLNGGTLELTNSSSLGLSTLNMAAGTTLLLQSSFGSFSNNVTLTGDPTFNVAAGVIMESSGTISDGASAGTLEKIGGGTLILIGADTYTGATNIDAGTLALSSGGSIAASSVVADAGIFDLSGAGASVSINSLSGAGSVVLGNTSLTLTAANDTFSGVIGGDGSLTISSGSETLTAYNTYTGGTTVSGGSLTIGDSTHTGAILGGLTNSGTVEFINADLSGMTTITNNGALNFRNSTSAGSVVITDIGGGTFNFFDTSTAANANITLNAGIPAFHDNSTAGNATITINGGIPQWLDNSTAGNANITINSGIPQWTGDSTAGNATITVNNGIPQWTGNSTAGNASITINGGIPQWLDNSTAGNATIVINGGIVQFLGNSTGGSAALTNNSILDFSGTTGPNGDNRISAGSIAGSGSLTIGANQLTVGSNNSSTTYSGGIDDNASGGSLVKVGSGTLTLSGSNSYTGATIVSAGTLTVDGSISSSSGVTVQSGTTLAGIGTVAATTIQSGAALTPGDGGTGTLTVNGNLTFQSGSALAEEVSPTGADKVMVHGNASLAGSLFALFAVGGNYGGGGTYTLLATTGTMSGTFSSFDTLGLPTAYRVDLSYGANDVLLTLTPNQFIWSATPGSSDWSTDANWVYDLAPRAGDTVEFAASSVTQVSITGAVAAGTIQLDSGAPAYSFAITGSAGGSASLTLSSGITQLTGNNASFTVSGADASHTGTIAFTGTGNAASSTLTAGAFGTISFAGNSDAGAGAALVAGSGGTVDFSATTGAAGDHNVTAGSIAGAGTFKLGADTLTVGALNTSTEVSGVISGTGGLTKTGTGALLLSGASTYTGATTVNGGILDVNGSIASTVTLAGGTLKGNGTVGGVNVGGGTLAPGNSIGTLNTGTITFSSGSTYQVEVNAAGQSDLINATGLATLNGAVQVLPAAGSYGPVTTYRIVNAGSISGTFASISSTLTTLTPSLIYGATSVDLKLVRNDVAFGTAYGTTPNQIAAGGAVSAGGGGTALYTALANAYTPTTIDATLDSMSGEIHVSLRSAALEDSRMIRDTVLERLTTAGTGLWAQGFAASGELDGNGNAAELHRNQAGFIAGFDMKLGDGIRAGLAGAYTGQHANLAARASQASSSGGAIIGYAGWQGGAWHVDLGGDYGWSNDSITRGNAALAETESSNSDSQSGQFFARLGYDTSLSGLPVMPYLGLAHVTATSGPFAESGGLAALSGAAKTDSQSYAALGARLTMPDLNLAAMPLALHADLGWSHALEGTTTGQVVSFATGQSFTVLGAPIGSDAATVQLGADLAIAPAAIFSLGYDGSFSSRGASHALRGGLEWRF